MNLLKDIHLCRLDENGFDRFNIAGQEYKYASGSERFVETLSQRSLIADMSCRHTYAASKTLPRALHYTI